MGSAVQSPHAFIAVILMSLLALLLVVIAAFTHASWNLLAKRAAHCRHFNWYYSTGSALLFMPFALYALRDFAPHFSVKHMLKDLQIANRLGRNFDLDLTVAGATRDRLLDEARQGRGDADYSSIARRFLPPLDQNAPSSAEPICVL